MLLLMSNLSLSDYFLTKHVDYTSWRQSQCVLQLRNRSCFAATLLVATWSELGDLTRTWIGSLMTAVMMVEGFA